MAEDHRISLNIRKFVAFMVITDNLQLQILTPPNILRYTLWLWTVDESNADKVGPAVRKKLNDLIIKVRKYDNDPIDGHHLLDLVALKGSTDDCETFNVKRGTTLAKKRSKISGETVTPQPSVTIRKILRGQHLLDVVNPNTPSSKARKALLQPWYFAMLEQIHQRR
jgi:hypothetical protein